MGGDRYDDPLYDPEDDEAEYDPDRLDGFIYEEDEEDTDGDD